MRQLLNQFSLKPGVSQAEFAEAWKAFADHLMQRDLAIGTSDIVRRHADSGFDTDGTRSCEFMALITFRDQAQADAAWRAIEEGRAPMGKLHGAVLSRVHDPVFTFWGSSE